MQYQKPVFPKHLLIIFFFLLPGIHINAQTDLSKRPMIGSHIFTPIAYSPLPAINTYFSPIVGFGKTINLFHYINDNDNLGVIGLHGEVTFVDLRVSYQQRVRDWLAAYIKVGMSARLGTELQSILAQGFNSITTFEIGWHLKILEGDKYAFTTTLELKNHNGSFINVLGFIRDILNDHPDPQLVKHIPVLTVGSGFRFAYGFNDLIGVNATADFSYGETYTRGKNGLTFIGGVCVDFDFYPRYSVPLGLVINYNISSMPDLVYVTGRSAHIWRAKIAYTKARDFSLGVECSIMKIPMTHVKKDPVVYTIGLANRFYF